MIFIADNDRIHLTSLQRLVRAAYPEDELWPPEARTLHNWKTVEDELASRTRDDENLIVILDLGLESEEMPSVRAGVEQAFGLRGFRQKATFIAYTQWPELAEGQPHYSETFDGLVDKQRLIGFETIEQQQTYIRQIISSATRRKRGAKAAYTLQDSVGLRLTAAAFGEQIFDFLAQEVALGWENLRIAALTSGHSGAFLLSISGTLQGGAQRIIVKCARDADLIRPDIRVGEFLAELGPLAEVLAPIEQELHPLPRNLGYYYRQAEIKGEPLLTQLASRPWDLDAMKSLDGILSVEIRCYERQVGEHFASLRPNQRFPLTPVDRGRADESLKFLADVGGSIYDSGQWPSPLAPVSVITATVSAILNNWDSLLASEGDLPAVGQHGDLNPGNVLVPTPGKAVLIDLARRGRWPVGYDVARLATILRIRLTDHTRHRDWVENRLAEWVKEDFACIEAEQNPGGSLCPWALYCDQAYRTYLLGREAAERPKLVRGYKLSTLWDLIKVLSYVDLSPFKRLWVLISCWRLSNALGLVR